jgi:hypothetical protein
MKSPLCFVDLNELDKMFAEGRSRFAPDKPKRVSAIDIIKGSGDFIPVESTDGVPTFALKPDHKCSVCGRNIDYCICGN